MLFIILGGGEWTSINEMPDERVFSGAEGEGESVRGKRKAVWGVASAIGSAVGATSDLFERGGVTVYDHSVPIFHGTFVPCRQTN